AHDINHPLAEVVESCDSLAANENLQADQAATARKIGQQARRTQYLISDLLSFAQQAQSEKAQVDLTAVLQRAIQLDSLRLQSHNIRVITHFEPGLPALIGNTNQLFQSIVEAPVNLTKRQQELLREFEKEGENRRTSPQS